MGTKFTREHGNAIVVQTVIVCYLQSTSYAETGPGNALSYNMPYESYNLPPVVNGSPPKTTTLKPEPRHELAHSQYQVSEITHAGTMPFHWGVLRLSNNIMGLKAENSWGGLSFLVRGLSAVVRPLASC